MSQSYKSLSLYSQAIDLRRNLPNPAKVTSSSCQFPPSLFREQGTHQTSVT